MLIDYQENEADIVYKVNIDGKIVVNKESIMSVIDNSVISISKDDFIGKPMKCIKELLKR